jgi:hypothetical protein
MSKNSRFKARTSDGDGNNLSMSLIYNEASSSSSSSPPTGNVPPVKTGLASKPAGLNGNSLTPVRGDPNLDESYGYDFVIIVPNPEHKDYKKANFVPDSTLEDIVERLQLGGLQTYVYKAADCEEFIIKIRIPLERLKEYAEQIEYDMKVDEFYLDEKIDCYGKKIAYNPGVNNYSKTKQHNQITVVYHLQPFQSFFRTNTFMRILKQVSCADIVSTALYSC